MRSFAPTTLAPIAPDSEESPMPRTPYYPLATYARLAQLLDRADTPRDSYRHLPPCQRDSAHLLAEVGPLRRRLMPAQCIR